jgi:hypothetical protein
MKLCAKPNLRKSMKDGSAGFMEKIDLIQKLMGYAKTLF